MGSSMMETSKIFIAISHKLSEEKQWRYKDTTLAKYQD